ncbi:hypothetical protein [Dyadobacter sp. Leaf189]|uniref:hypothetical protein n=1 Tax=Dyadobacter sp. Leaf189 TaxID=1736295 RepID=UPI0006FE142D|nr:hypothetical protein [Dyadobacter sp. Leaf189]KQS28173.1 hypothetical protein ASG33_17470 [Dyadobacter sp. Leaf189]
MKNFRNSWSIVLLAALFGCSSSKTMTYESKWNAPFTYVDEVKPDQQDQRSRLKYGIINDDQFVYITLKTKDPSTIQNILSSGLKIAFSPEGQKKEAYSLLFPVVMKEDRKALKRIDTDLPNSLGLDLLLDSYNKEAVWKDKSGQHFINLVVPDGSIKSRISMDKNGELTEQIVIPFSLMAVNAKETSMLGVNIKVEGQSSQSGFSPRIGIGLGGGIGMGGGMGVGIGTGGSRYNNNERNVDIRLEVQLARAN